MKVKTIIHITMILGILLLAGNVLAAEEGAAFRPMYDLIMKWINFSLLAYLLIRFLKTPLLNFLSGRKEVIAAQIEKLENEKKRIQTEIATAEKALTDGSQRLIQIKERIVKQGEQQKEKIIEDAQTHSRQLLEDARRKIDIMVQQARTALRDELVDTSFALAQERLSRRLTDRDQQEIVQDYLTLLK